MVKVVKRTVRKGQVRMDGSVFRASQEVRDGDWYFEFFYDHRRRLRTIAYGTDLSLDYEDWVEWRKVE